MSKLLELLGKFIDRSTDPALYGRNCRADVIFNQVATELAQAIRDDEPDGLIKFVPITAINVIHAAVHFNPDSELSWQEIGNACIRMQNGAAS